MIPAPVAPSPTQPARGGGQEARGAGQTVKSGGHPVRGLPRGEGQSGGAQPHFYSYPARPKVESSDTIIAGIILVCDRDASILFDMGSTYSYVSSYFASYRACLVTIESYDTRVYLLLVDIVDFDVILCKNWLSPYHVILYCHAKTVTLAMPGFPRLEWRGIPGLSTSRVMSYMKARRIVKKGF
ncbi:uncharacterized protein [Nicotiana tomentosiformis]|uniref:uncharacterized protein n=1 Tax=Nicotiana tomentosiformis TaxID=4098 RepID=UPI00388C8DE4